MRKIKNKSFLTQTKTYDFFCDDLYEAPKESHALCTYEKTTP